MRKILFFAFLHLGNHFSFAVVDLKTSFESALQKNETLPIAESEQEQAESRVSQAFGRVLPRLSVIGAYQLLDTPVTSKASLLSAEQSSARFNLTQPVFRGLSDIYGYRATRAQARAQKALAFNSKLSVYGSVAQAYYGVLSAEKDLSNLRLLLDLTQKRVGELKQRTKIGRSRKGELLAAESQVALVKVQVENANSQLGIAREQFQLNTGMPADSQLVDDPAKQEAHSASLDLFLNMVEKRPDIEAARESVDSADNLVTASKGLHWPTIDFAANYYVHRTGILKDAKWDIGVTATIPLFEGFSTQAQVEENIARRKTQELRLAQARRNAIREIRSQFLNFKSVVIQHDTLEEAAKLAEENYKQQQQEYRYGLVTNLDVLQSLNTFQETKRNLDRTHYQAKLALVQLQAAVGQLP